MSARRTLVPRSRRRRPGLDNQAPRAAPTGPASQPAPQARPLLKEGFQSEELDVENVRQLPKDIDTAAMAYIAPIQRASSVRHALKLNFLDPDEECLVIAKSNRLEFHVLTPEGLALKQSRIVYGQIVMLEKLRPSSSQTDHLFVGTDRHMYFTLSWDPALRQLKTEQSVVDLGDPNGRDSQSRDRCFVDPRHKYITLELYEGVITLLPVHTKQPRGVAEPVDIGNLTGDYIPIRISEILVRSSTYLNYRTNNEKEKARIATLYEDNQERAWLKVRTLVPSKDLDYADLEEEKIVLPDKLDPTASHLLPVPNPVNGVLILSETRITWSDGADEFKMQPLEAATSWLAWAHVEDWRWLLADEFGWLYFLMIEFDEDEGHVHGFKLDKLKRQVSTPSTLVHLGGGFVYVGSHSGDSQVIQITPEDLVVLQTLPNLAPILDVAIMDMGSRAGEGQVNEYSSGQARLVTGSGAWQDGSLRSVRSGVGVEEFGSIDLGDGTAVNRAATDMFHLRVNSASRSGDLLLASYVDNTRMFFFAADGSVEEIQSMICNEPTILAQTLPELGHFVQCTSGSVTVYDQNLQLTSSWRVPELHRISAASASNENIVVSLGGTELLTLDLKGAARNAELQVIGRRKFDDQVSCLNIPNIASKIILVGFWQSTSLSILAVPDLGDIHNTPVSDDPSAVPRSVLLTQVLPDHPPTLFLSLADGHVVTFNVEKDTFALSGRQATILGTQQANLKILPREENLYSVFAIAEHSTLIYGSENRLVYSAVTAEEATCICSFDSSAYPGAVALATPSEVKIAQVERERTTHVQTLPIGETVRRISYSPELRVFGLGTVRRCIEDNAEVVTSHFRLADEINFKVLSEFKLNDEEVVEAVCRIPSTENRRQSERFAVGTCYLDDSQGDNRGRIIIFEVTEDRLLKEVTEVKLKGACRALSMLDGKIVAAMTKTVVVFAFESDSLQKKASYRTATEPIDCHVKDSHIIVSDLMKSVSILKYECGEAGVADKLTEIARHHQIVWSTAVAPVDENTVLESDADGNLMLLRQNVSGVTADDQRRLETISEMRLGEMVNKIKPVDVPASASAVVVPRAFLATVNGGIYIFGVIRPAFQNLLMNLQTNIAKLVRSPGDVPWAKWRAFRNDVREESEPLRFVDGELVEMFLEADAATQAEMVKDLDVGVEEVRVMVEGLRRTH